MENIGTTSEFNQGTQNSTETVTNTVAASAAAVQSVVDLLQQILDGYLESANQPPESVSIRVGSKTVYKGSLDGSGDLSLDSKQKQVLSTLIQDPTKVQGSVRIFGDDPKVPIYHNTAGTVKLDALQLFQSPSTEQISFSQPLPPPPPPSLSTEENQFSQSFVPSQFDTAQTTAQVIQTLAPSGDLEQLINEIYTLKDRVVTLESKLNQLENKRSFLDGAKDKVNNWFNGVRNRAAVSVISFADKIAASAQEEIGAAKVALQGKVDGVVQGVKERAEQDQQLIRGKVDRVVQRVQDRVTQDQQLVRNTIQGVQDSVNGVVQGVQDRATRDQQLVRDTIQGVQDSVNGVVQGVQDRATQDQQLIVNKIDSVLNTVRSIPEQIGINSFLPVSSEQEQSTVRTLSDASVPFQSDSEIQAYQFLRHTVEPRVRDLINHLPSDAVNHLEDGTKQFSSQEYDYQLKPDNQVAIIPHDSRASVNYDNFQDQDILVFSAIVARIDEKLQSQQQTQSPLTQQTNVQQIKPPVLRA